MEDLSSSSVPYKIFEVNHPNLKNFTEHLWQESEYGGWTEMKFFNAKQVQEMISPEFPDNRWNINPDAEKFMREDIRSAIDGKPSFSVEFRFGL